MSYPKLAEKALQNAHDFKEIAEKLLEEKRKLVEEKKQAHEKGFQEGFLAARENDLDALKKLKNLDKLIASLQEAILLMPPALQRIRNLAAPLLKPEFSRPPLGLRPEFVAIEHRIAEIEQACDRYRMAHPAVALGREVPSAWTAELNRLKDRLEQLRLEKYPEVGT